jgi:SAM-dependent methyltransferase
MLKIYKYNNTPFITINKFQKKKIAEFEEEIKSNNFKLIKNICICGKVGADKKISSRDRYGMKISNFICSSCGLVRQNPTLDENSLKKFYQDYYRKIYEGQQHDLNFDRIFSSQEVAGEKIYKLLKDVLNKKNLNIKNFNNVLEIGCGPGGILSTFNKKGHDVTGIDYDDNYSEMIKKKNIKFINNDFMSDGFKGQYDIIILSHVIEHFLELNKIIEKLYEILKPKGILYILTPGIFLYKNYNFLHLSNNYKRMLFLFYIQNAHIYYFTLNSLKNIFIKFKNKFKFIYGDEEIQAVYVKDQEDSSIKEKNDYKKIIRFYYFNYYRFLFFRQIKQIKTPIKILINVGIKIKRLMGIKKKIFK